MPKRFHYSTSDMHLSRACTPGPRDILDINTLLNYTQSNELIRCREKVAQLPYESETVCIVRYVQRKENNNLKEINEYQLHI